MTKNLAQPKFFEGLSVYIFLVLSSKKRKAARKLELLLRSRHKAYKIRIYVLRVRSDPPTLNIRMAIREGSSAR